MALSRTRHAVVSLACLFLVARLALCDLVVPWVIAADDVAGTPQPGSTPPPGGPRSGPNRPGDWHDQCVPVTPDVSDLPWPLPANTTRPPFPFPFPIGAFGGHHHDNNHSEPLDPNATPGPDHHHGHGDDTGRPPLPAGVTPDPNVTPGLHGNGHDRAGRPTLPAGVTPDPNATPNPNGPPGFGRGRPLTGPWVTPDPTATPDPLATMVPCATPVLVTLTVESPANASEVSYAEPALNVTWTVAEPRNWTAWVVYLLTADWNVSVLATGRGVPPNPIMVDSSSVDNNDEGLIATPTEAKLVIAFLETNESFSHGNGSEDGSFDEGGDRHAGFDDATASPDPAAGRPAGAPDGGPGHGFGGPSGAFGGGEGPRGGPSGAQGGGPGGDGAGPIGNGPGPQETPLGGEGGFGHGNGRGGGRGGRGGHGGDHALRASAIAYTAINVEVVA